MSPIDFVNLATILQQHGPALELFARQHCRTPADVVQEALLQLARQRQMPENVVGWLFRVVRNGAVSASRAEQRRNRHEQAAASLLPNWFEPSPDARLDADEASRQLASLPLEEREVIVAHLWGGLSFEEIATMTESSSSTAHRRYQSGLSALREKLGVSCPIQKTNTSR